MVLHHDMNVLLTSLNVVSAVLSAEGTVGGNNRNSSRL